MAPRSRYFRRSFASGCLQYMKNEQDSSPAATPPIRRIAFVHSGKFSHVNDAVRELLKTQFPASQIDAFDTNHLPIWNRRHRFKMALDAFRLYGAKGIRGRAAVARFGPRTVPFFDDARSGLM